MCIEQTVRCKWHADAVIDDVKKMFLSSRRSSQSIFAKIKNTQNENAVSQQPQLHSI